MGDYKIQVTDIEGNTIYFNQEKTLMPKETMELDLGFLVPSFYLVRIWSKENSLLQAVKILKQ
jgi:hypothetical protein